MALNSAKELLERTMNDAELRERIMQSEPDGIVALAGELGLDMTVEELSEAMKTAGKPDGSRPKEMGLAELEQVAGGTPYLGEGVINFFSWVACGFNHHYEYTGETQQRIDFAFKVDFSSRDAGIAGTSIGRALLPRTSRARKSRKAGDLIERNGGALSILRNEERVFPSGRLQKKDRLPWLRGRHV